MHEVSCFRPNKLKGTFIGSGEDAVWNIVLELLTVRVSHSICGLLTQGLAQWNANAPREALRPHQHL